MVALVNEENAPSRVKEPSNSRTFESMLEVRKILAVWLRPYGLLVNIAFAAAYLVIIIGRRRTCESSIAREIALMENSIQSYVADCFPGIIESPYPPWIPQHPNAGELGNGFLEQLKSDGRRNDGTIESR